jgi:hypothetical protein
MMVCSITQIYDKENRRDSSRNKKDWGSSSNTTKEETSKSFDCYKQMILNWIGDEKLSCSESEEVMSWTGVQAT